MGGVECARISTYLTSDRDVKSAWTNYHPLIGTKVYKEDILGIRPKRER
jgi:hypothetical protein